MKKEDAPRLKRFLALLMKNEFGRMTGQEIVRLVRDMEWLADYAEKLDRPAITPMGPSTPIEGTTKKGKKRG